MRGWTRTRFLNLACVISLLLTLRIPCRSLANDDPVAVTEKLNPNRQSPIKIGRETTYLTQPVHSGGGIDYISAIEAELRQNVTPANNAAIPLLRALGPAIIPQKHQSEYFKKLGMEVPLGSEDDFMFLADFGANEGLQESVVYGHWRNLVRGDQDSTEPTVIVEWLKRNNEALDQIVKATKKKQFYVPLIAKDVGARRMLLLADFPVCDAMRDASQALIARTYVNMNDKKYAAAWDDLFASYCLARLMEQMALQWPLVIAAGIDFQFTRALCDFVNRCPDGSIVPSECLAALKSRPLRADSSKMIRYERYALLDSILLASINKLPNLKSTPSKQRSLFQNMMYSLVLKIVSWNSVARQANVFCDSLEFAFTQLSPHETAKELSMLGQRIRNWKAEMPVPSLNPTDSLIAKMQGLSVQATQFFARKLISNYLIDYTRFYIAYRVQQTYHEANHTILAIESYCASEHRFPERLDDLCPDYLPVVPKSPFLNQRFEYIAESDSTYILRTLFRDEGAPRPEAGPQELNFNRRIKGSLRMNPQARHHKTIWVFVVLLVVICATIFFWRMSQRKQHHNRLP